MVVMAAISNWFRSTETRIRKYVKNQKQLIIKLKGTVPCINPSWNLSDFFYEQITRALWSKATGFWSKLEALIESVSLNSSFFVIYLKQEKSKEKHQTSSDSWNRVGMLWPAQKWWRWSKMSKLWSSVLLRRRKRPFMFASSASIPSCETKSWMVATQWLLWWKAIQYQSKGLWSFLVISSASRLFQIIFKTCCKPGNRLVESEIECPKNSY